jgi:hypothetical protein
MAFDEAFSVHEMLIMPTRKLLGGDDLGILFYAWVVPGIAIILLVGLFMSRFLFRLSAKTRNSFLIAATLYIGGIIGVEFIGGYYAELYWIQNLTYKMITTVEESLEMAGVIVFIWALLVYVADNFEEVRFQMTVTSEP